ncbi:sensor histidine kinase [Pseudonocardiaceae bacterium YIM PH 21723]|nr:sensor histidine kinase [Pseudonocardiaceae bacterium YIM PH 21723]
MRTRLLIVLLTLSALAVTGFAWPLLTSTASRRTQELIISRTAELDRFAAITEPEQLAAEADAYHRLYGEDLLVVDARRRPVAEAGLKAGDPALAGLIDGALRNQPGPVPARLTPWSTQELILSRPIGTGTRVAGAVVLRASVTAAVADITVSWLIVLAGAVLAATAFVLLALVVSRWVLKPLASLSGGVGALTEGRRGAHVPVVAGPTELRVLAAEFNRMSDAVALAEENQRRLVADASHQLRNPMAALRLRVDSLGDQVTEAGRTSYRGCVSEVERMESLLDGLLSLAAADDAGAREADGDCDAAAVLLDRCTAWQAAAEQSAVHLVPPGDQPPVLVAIPEPELAEVLDVLLDNAIKYAGTGATVASRIAPDGSLVVTDTGPGLSRADRARATRRFWRAATVTGRGTGLGLAIAQRLLTARGGHLELREHQPHGLEVHLTLPVVTT